MGMESQYYLRRWNPKDIFFLFRTKGVIKMSQYPLASSSWDQEEIQAIHNIIDSGNYSMGSYVSEYEKYFSDYVKSTYSVMVNSGSSANLLMVAALFYKKDKPLKKGDEVIVPAVSWATTYYPLYQYGLKLKFVDIDIDTLNYDLKALEKAITDQTKLIMVVNLLGNPNDFHVIEQLTSNRDIVIIEDNCESLGAVYKGQQAGTFGIMGSFSSFFSHHISTMEGGVIVTDDEEIFHILMSLRAHGWTRNLPKFNHVCGEKSDNSFEESFRFVLPGYNVRPIEMSGAIGIEQIKKLPNFIHTRRDNAQYFIELFENNPYFKTQKEIGMSSWFGFSLIIQEDAPFKRSDVVRLLQRANIDCRPIVAGNFAKNEVMKWFDYEIAAPLLNSENIDHNGLFVGNHQIPIKEEIKYLRDTLQGNLI
jgi:CDP-6-deoxy-D-xylo-4-hexulose-3-dehydrase